ncbi:NAD-dependent glycerol-3-phosphate dehydrogenase N-terminal domain protein [Leptospira interrogans serovar Canicola]|nr:NAD-dependent glycerol-3-phosphate dehydrogenase N-terminal domain protein [Leptospira interrogans serovar Canicola]
MEEIKSSTIIPENIAVLGGGPMGIYLSTYLSPKAKEIYLWYDDRKKSRKNRKRKNSHHT